MASLIGHRRSAPLVIVAVTFVFAIASYTYAQPPQAAPAGPPPTPKAAAPEDITGYWVSVVTEDWRYRMLTPAKGDYASVPLTAEGRKAADAWDPDKDETSGNQCKAYGAAALMRQPGRLHVTWQDDNALKIETDAGTQTRLFHFGKAQSTSGEPSWQGDSVAQWEVPGGGRGGGRGGQAQGGSLKVVTTRMRPGYLRKNGVPYSANTLLTEYYSRTIEPNGDSWLIVTTVVEDSQNLNQPFITSTHFKKLPDASGWNPTPCAAK